MINDQCSGSSHAICLNGKCACDEGYIASTSFDCELGMRIIKTGCGLIKG